VLVFAVIGAGDLETREAGRKSRRICGLGQLVGRSGGTRAPLRSAAIDAHNSWAAALSSDDTRKRGLDRLVCIEAKSRAFSAKYTIG
jgi:hypothetical protein